MTSDIMKLTIDNEDYTGTIDAEQPPRILRRLNKPSEMAVSLVADTAAFVVPAPNARVILSRNNDDTIFTGFLSGPPEHDYLGWGERGPAYRYTVHATSDESRLTSRLLPERGEFVATSAGAILKTLANDAGPGALDTAECEDVSVLPSYWPDPRRRFDEHAAELALRARAAYRAKDGRLFLRVIGATRHVLEETSPNFCPEAFKLESAAGAVNDVTVTARSDPALSSKTTCPGTATR